MGLLVTLLLLALLGTIKAAGNEEDVLVETNGATPDDTTDRISYQCTFRNLWTPKRQPVNFPILPRWGGPILWTHTLQFQPWHAGSAVTRGIEKLAEVRKEMMHAILGPLV